MIRSKKTSRTIINNMLCMEQRMGFLEEQNETLTGENNRLKADITKMENYVKGLEWDIEAICGYLEEKRQEKEE